MGDLLMSAKEVDRLTVLSQVADNQQLSKEVAVILGLSYRQTKRIWRLFKQLGKEGLVSRKRGRASNSKISEALEHATSRESRDTPYVLF